MAKILVGTKTMDATLIQSQFIISKEDARMLLLENEGVNVFAILPQTLTYADFLKLNSILDVNFSLNSTDVVLTHSPGVIAFNQIIQEKIVAEIKKLGTDSSIGVLNPPLILSAGDKIIEIENL